WSDPQTMDAVYPLNSQPVSLCLIINNVDFTSFPVKRGSDKDAQSLAEVFSELGFRVLMCKNQIKEQMEVEECHGVKGAVLGTNKIPLIIKHITRTFRATEQSALKGKPKVFLIQASQGCQSVDPAEDNCGGGSIPLEADVLVAIAAAEGFLAFRHKTDGNWFIQSVCQQLKERCLRGEDLLTILQHEGALTEKIPHQPGKVKQMPVVTSNLTKKLVFSLHNN
uniref:Caspase family p20 domain-containing protein n=1 Tax=Acanthochromis polyacanthus TaxID=80966 RepID=A0A3Q1ED03_9TELE